MGSCCRDYVGPGEHVYSLRFEKHLDPHWLGLKQREINTMALPVLKDGMKEEFGEEIEVIRVDVKRSKVDVFYKRSQHFCDCRRRWNEEDHLLLLLEKSDVDGEVK